MYILPDHLDGYGKDITPVLSPLHGIPVRVRYDQFFPSTASPHHHPRKTRMRIYISVKDRVFWGTSTTHWLHTTPKLRNVGVPRYFFTTGVPESYRVVISVTPRTFLRRSLDPGIQGISISAWGWFPRGDPVRYSVRDHNHFHLISLTFPPIGFRCLASLFYGRKFKRPQ